MKKGKIISFIIGGVALLCLVGGALFQWKIKSDESKPTPEPQVTPSPNETPSYGSMEKYFVALEEQLVKYSKEVFPEGITWERELERYPEGLNYGLSVNELKDIYQKDISMFTHDKYECDLDKTTVVLYITKEKKEYKASLFCHQTNPLTEEDHEQVE